MAKRSFQRFPLMLGSHHILFKAPAVVSDEVYIPSALVVLFHYANVLVKALTLLFTQISTVVWKIVQVVRLQKCSLMDILAPSWLQLLSCSSTSFSYSALGWFPRKFVTTVFNYCQAESSASLSALANIGSFMNSFIWVGSNIPAVSFSMLIHWNFSWRKAKPLPPLSVAFTKFFLTSNLICISGSSILFSSTRWDWTLCQPSFNPCLNGHSCLT